MSKTVYGTEFDSSIFQTVYEKYRDEFDSIADVYRRAEYLANLYAMGDMERLDRWFLTSDEEYIRLNKSLISV